MDDIIETQEQEAIIPAAPVNVCKVRCITELRPWANVLDGERQGLRPMDIDEVLTVPASEGQILQKNRHAIIVG